MHCHGGGKPADPGLKKDMCRRLRAGICGLPRGDKITLHDTDTAIMPGPCGIRKKGRTARYCTCFGSGHAGFIISTFDHHLGTHAAQPFGK